MNKEVTEQEACEHRNVRKNVAQFALEIEKSNLSEPARRYLANLLCERENPGKEQDSAKTCGLLEREGSTLVVALGSPGNT